MALGGELLLRQHARRHAELLQRLAVGHHVRHGLRPVRHVIEARALLVVVDLLLAAELIDQVDGVELALHVGAGAVETELLDHRLDAELARREGAEAAVAARGAPAQVVRLQHAHVAAVVLGQVVGGRDAAEAAADDGHLAGLRTGQRAAVLRRRRRRRLPVGGDRRLLVEILVVEGGEGHQPFHSPSRRTSSIASRIDLRRISIISSTWLLVMTSGGESTHIE